MCFADAFARQGSGSILSSLFGGDEAAPHQAALRTVKPSNSTINVFSLASGHLYERFLSIMMRTVRGTTQAPVKFWFLRQFLSPQFKVACFPPLPRRRLFC